MSSTVCHVEYPTEDLDRSRQFAEAQFGWVFRQFGESMLVFGTAEGHIGGFMKGTRATGRMSPAVSYKVDSIDESLSRAQGLGASIGDTKHEVPGVGWYASVIAPDGNEFGMVEFTS